MTGNRLPEDTCLALFGRKRWGYHHDLPAPLEAFTVRTEGRMGSARDIAGSRTVAPFYLVHRDRTCVEDAYRSLVEPVPGMLKFRLGLLTSRFRANHPLKACPICMRDDERAYGVAYWHRLHQFPGVWTCPAHGVPLATCTVKSTGVQRFSWVTPNPSQLAQLRLEGLPADGIDALRKFSELAAAWGEMPEASLDQKRLACLYRTRLGPTSVTLDRAQSAAEYCACVLPLRSVPELVALPGTAAQALHQFNRWIVAPRGSAHPLRHLSIIYWLFSDWTSFLVAHNDTGDLSHQPESPEIELASHSDDPRRPALLTHLANGRSVSWTARELGIAVQTAICWAAADGIATPKRPKVLIGDAYRSLIESLEAGHDKGATALAHAVSVQTVTRVLRSEPGLSDRWHRVRFEQAQDQARAKWLAVVQLHGALGTKHVRHAEPAAYAWLYRNDRVWLLAHSKQITAARTNNSAVAWDQRDSALAAQVQQLAALLAADSKSYSVKLWQLYQAIPELKAKLGALDRLPLTKQAIKVATMRRARGDGSKPLC